MNRRTLIGAALLAALPAVPALGYIPEFHRLSTVPWDPGEPAWRALRARGIWPRVTLDGVVQDTVETVDVKLGFVRRLMKDANGDLIVRDNHGIIETVRGRVEITFEQ